jgi:hypothetical protein
MSTINKSFDVEAEEELRIFLDDEEKMSITVRNNNNRNIVRFRKSRNRRERTPFENRGRI